ncbi:MAG TPA: ATP-dependent helicase [Gemmatimonadaceae bacterium]|nr:ATP-dependent helicase [Gemmatimonadaceae bacterium]
MSHRTRTPARSRPPTPPHAHDAASGLNAAQRTAATFGDGPLLIVAGAGTGKTRTLVHRVAHLIERGVPAHRILLLTFTRRAAQEMLGRVGRLVGPASAQVQGGTFHATAHRLLRMYGAAAGIAQDFTILDQSDAVELMGIARAHLGYGARGSRFPKKETLHHVYSRHVNTDIPVEEILRDDYPRFLRDAESMERVFAVYTTRKAERNLVDYNDLLLFWAAMLSNAPELGARIAALYDHVLVDEYQDTNALQARILRGMCDTHRNLTVVGDDAQSIYAFRGADVRNILEFPRHFPGTTIVPLEQNYRSTQPILDATNALIARAPRGYAKTLRTDRTGGVPPCLVVARDEHEQTRFVVDRVLALHEEGTPLREMAVLFRSGYMSADLEIELANRKIPFEKWGGLKFLEAAHVKDVLAFLRILENTRDEVSWYRVLRLLPGIGDATARSAVDAMTERRWDPRAFAAYVPPPRAREAHHALAQLFDAVRAQDPAGSAPGAEIALFRTMYDDVLRERYDHADPRLADLDQLQTIAGGFPSRAAFLAELALDPPASTQDLAGAAGPADDDALILSTVHSAKGREWDAVFVISAVDGSFPSSRSLRRDEDTEEERRLMYVAMTRARHELSILYPLNSYSSRFGADYSFGQLSRFIDASVQARMQRVVAASGEALPAATPAAAPVLDVRALVRSRFEKREGKGERREDEGRL